MNNNPESPIKMVPFLTQEKVREIQNEFGTPVYIYDQKTLEHQAQKVLNFPNEYGLTARYAMKACPTASVIKVLTNTGLHIDASSGYEVERAMKAGISSEKIQITVQQIPNNLQTLIEQGVQFNASSIAQLDIFGKLFPGKKLSIRVNPGLGSGHNNRTNVGGPTSSFGIWHEYVGEALEVAQKYDLIINQMHTHIGSGSDPEVWGKVAMMSLDICEHLKDVSTLSLGGGFKVGRMNEKYTTDLQKIGRPIVEAFKAYEKNHGIKLHLEVEPGTFLVSNACALLVKAIDVVNTGQSGYRFIKVDSGMTEILRMGMYGEQHPIEIVSQKLNNNNPSEYVIVGHCCESGDILTPEEGNPENLKPRLLPETHIDDLLVIGGTGAYCSAMAAKNYNSFPEAAEVMISRDGKVELIRRCQTFDQIIQNEVIPSFL